MTSDLSADVSGLASGASLSLILEFGDESTTNTYVIPGNGLQSLIELAFGTPYAVSVINPPGQSCAVTNGESTSGFVDAIAEVTCTNLDYDLKVSVSGLESGDFITLNDGSIITSNGIFTIGSVEYQSDYNIFITNDSDRQSCTIAGTNIFFEFSSFFSWSLLTQHKFINDE